MTDLQKVLNENEQLKKSLTESANKAQNIIFHLEDERDTLSKKVKILEIEIEKSKRIIEELSK